MNATKVGMTVGRAIARDVLADGMPREWTGLDEQDGERLVSAGIEPDSDEWDMAVAAARASYEEAIIAGRGISSREGHGAGAIAT